MTDEGFSSTTSDATVLTLTVDASDFGVWNYISLKNKTIEKQTIPLACEGEWDGMSGITYHEVKGTIDNLLNYQPKVYSFNAPVTTGTTFQIGLNIELEKLCN